MTELQKARLEWHRQLGLNGISRCPTEAECKAFDAGFNAAAPTPQTCLPMRWKVHDTEKGGRCMLYYNGEPAFAMAKAYADMVADALNKQ